MTQPTPASQKPDSRLATATAAKVGSSTTAVIDGVTVTIQVARDLTVAAGDVLYVTRFGSQWFAVARSFVSAPAAQDNDIAPDPKPATVNGTLVVSPEDTGSYRSGVWRTDSDDVAQGVYGGAGNSTGAVFFGDKLRSLAGAVVLAATMIVKRTPAGLNGALATTMRLVTETDRPAGAPTLGASTPGPALLRGAGQEDFVVPTAWVQQMVDGTAGGLAFYDATGTPFVVFAGRGTYSPAFTLVVDWQRG